MIYINHCYCVVERRKTHDKIDLYIYKKKPCQFMSLWPLDICKLSNSGSVIASMS